MSFFDRSSDLVAPALLGALFTHNGVTIRITEVEAYLGAADPASHAARARSTANAALFGPAGQMYVYHSYGIHKAGNLVCHVPGGSGGVLLRAGAVVDGATTAFERRGPVPFQKLASGPGNLGKALGFDIDDNFAPITLGAADSFSLQLPIVVPAIARGPRIGISRNAEAPLRFWIPFDKSVSGRRGLGITV